MQSKLNYVTIKIKLIDWFFNQSKLVYPKYLLTIHFTHTIILVKIFFCFIVTQNFYVSAAIVAAKSSEAASGIKRLTSCGHYDLYTLIVIGLKLSNRLSNPYLLIVFPKTHLSNYDAEKITTLK
jgi:hypothetical protein